MICLDVCCCCLVLSHVKHFCDPMDYILQGCSVHGISQARILEQVVISLPRGSSQPRDWTPLPSLGGIFTTETEINMYLLSIYVSELPESLLSVINFGKFSVMITSNILFFFFFFCNYSFCNCPLTLGYSVFSFSFFSFSQSALGASISIYFPSSLIISLAIFAFITYLSLCIHCSH